MDAVADVGVDVNHACTHAHGLGALFFVPGLGPRKALALKQAVRGLPGSRTVLRKQLAERRLLGPKVYANAAGFLRIRDRNGLSDPNAAMNDDEDGPPPLPNPLDDSVSSGVVSPRRVESSP